MKFFKLPAVLAENFIQERENSMTDNNNLPSISRFSCSPDQNICIRSHLLPLLLLFLLLFIVYFNSFKGAWIFDDYHNIVDNKYVHLQSLDWSSIKETFYGVQDNKISRPLSYLSFGINYFFHELNTFGYHWINFLIHCIAAMFLYLFIYQVLRLPILNGRFNNRAGSIALLATTLWAINPIQVTAVTVIVQRMASMAGMFFIMAMFFYLMGRISPEMQKKIIWFCLCFLSGILAVASKENAAMLPIVLYIFDLLLIQGISRINLKRQLIIAGVPLALLLMIAFILSDPLSFFSASAYSHRPFTLIERLLTQPRILLFYLSLMFYPLADRFTLIYDIPVSTSIFLPFTTLPAIFFWITWLGISLYLANKRPLISFCLLFFMMTHFVESSFIALELIFEHRNYIPSMMLFLLAGVGIIAFLKDFSKKKSIIVISFLALATIIAAQGHTVFQRNDLFEHPIFLWTDNLEKAPLQSRVYANLGLEYDKIGKFQAARDSYIKAIELDRYPRLDARAVPICNLANYYLKNGDKEGAMSLYRQSISIDPTYLPAKQGMIVALLIEGDLEQARLLTEETLASGKAGSIYLEFYSLILLRQGNYASAIEQALKVMNINDKPLFVEKVLGEAHMQLKQYEKAHQFWMACALAYPDEPEAYIALANLAHIRQDKKTAQFASRHLFFLKGNKTWNYLANNINRKNFIIPAIFTGNTEKTLFLVRQTLEKEIGE